MGAVGSLSALASPSPPTASRSPLTAPDLPPAQVAAAAPVDGTAVP